MLKLKKILAAISASAVMLSCLTACGSTDTATEADETAASETETEVQTVSEIRDITSMELISEMKIGWNLGNTLDSTITDPSGDESVETWETAWGNPVTTKAMIDQVKSQGFNVLRIPVTWEGKFGEAPDYTIREDWLARVKEVVNYGIENDMFVILNMHHEEWHSPTKDNEAQATEMITALWTQIAEYFSGYDEHLLFEGMNEPRLKGHPAEWNGGDAEAREVINNLNAAFVAAVRATGGNNTLRHLMVPTYAASTLDTVLDDFVLPDDDKVIVSVHAYLPYSFALADDGVDTWSVDNTSDTQDIDELMLKLKERFIDNGTAVIIGEFGTRNRFNTEERAACASYYVTKATEIGVPCIWWDNNAFVGNGENFGLFERKTFEWRYPEIISAMMEAVGD
ncbi:MAG: glycoside hydrolase family 5 protein [Oscillospiraceae bacterium]|nr:glycoside hydrolase family 5 protein [Oscillospiraceae bacterium]